MREVRLSKLNNNDDTCRLTQWLVSAGDRVQAQQPIASVETSKAQVEVESEAAGIFQPLAKPNEDHPFGTVIALLFDSEEERAQYLAGRAAPPPEASAAAPLTLTADAQALVREHGITEQALRGLGRTVIRRRDVEALIPARLPDNVRPLSKVQRAVAQVVTQSHATIPAAFLAVKVRAEAVRALAQAETKRTGQLIGVTEVVLHALARLAEAHPLAFASLRDDHLLELHPAPNVGVAIDTGAGLFVPVIREAHRLSLEELARTLAGFRAKAAHGQFTEADLSGGHLSVALAPGAEVVISVPIVLPGQAAMLSLGGVMDQLELDREGKPVKRPIFHLGLSYDHRILNGSDALRFCAALKRALEQRAPAQE